MHPVSPGLMHLASFRKENLVSSKIFPEKKKVKGKYFFLSRFFGFFRGF